MMAPSAWCAAPAIGVVDISGSRVEPVDEIARRLGQALEHIDPRRLVAAPDCGLGLLGRSLAVEKLSNMCAAVRGVSSGGTSPATQIGRSFHLSSAPGTTC